MNRSSINHLILLFSFCCLFSTQSANKSDVDSDGKDLSVIAASSIPAACMGRATSRSSVTAKTAGVASFVIKASYCITVARSCLTHVLQISTSAPIIVPAKTVAPASTLVTDRIPASVRRTRQERTAK